MAYRVDVLAPALLDGTVGLEPRPDLLISLLPASKERAEHLLATVLPLDPIALVAAASRPVGRPETPTGSAPRGIRMKL